MSLPNPHILEYAETDLRSNIGVARLTGLMTDLNLDSKKYSNASMSEYDRPNIWPELCNRS